MKRTRRMLKGMVDLRPIKRRSVALRILLLLALLAALPALAHLTDWLGGAFCGAPEDPLSPAAEALVARAYADLGPDPVADYHAHLVGLGTDATGAAINPEMTTWRHPLRRYKAGVFLSGAGVQDPAHGDAEYVLRLVRLARGLGHPARLHLLAMDRCYRPDGTVDEARTEFYVPNERAVAVARQYPDLFVPVISVHPDRPGALAELDRWAGQGVRFVKWLPNAQNIDPADPRHDAFYRKLCDRHMVLLAHTGAEGAVSAAGAQELGNPLRLRHPLDFGVTVIMAHCASRGRSADLDQPGRTADNFDLFLRMMDDPRYQGRLFADLSAVAQWNRLPRPLLTILRRPDLQARLVNGSDYPLPAINCTISLRRLVRLGVLAATDRAPLAEIYRHNPLLFDFVLKRLLHDPATGARLPPSVFRAYPQLARLSVE